MAGHHHNFSDGVTDGTTFQLPVDAGNDFSISRGDHQHGTPWGNLNTTGNSVALVYWGADVADLTAFAGGAIPNGSWGFTDDGHIYYKALGVWVVKV